MRPNAAQCRAAPPSLFTSQAASALLCSARLVSSRFTSRAPRPAPCVSSRLLFFQRPALSLILSFLRGPNLITPSPWRSAPPVPPSCPLPSTFSPHSTTVCALCTFAHSHSNSCCSETISLSVVRVCRSGALPTSLHITSTRRDAMRRDATRRAEVAGAALVGARSPAANRISICLLRALTDRIGRTLAAGCSYCTAQFLQ